MKRSFDRNSYRPDLKKAKKYNDLTYEEKRLNDQIIADSSRLKSKYVNLSNLFHKNNSLNVKTLKNDTSKSRNTSILTTISSINTDTNRRPSKTYADNISTDNESVSIKNFCRMRRKSLSKNMN